MVDSKSADMKFVENFLLKVIIPDFSSNNFIYAFSDIQITFNLLLDLNGCLNFRNKFLKTFQQFK